MAMALTESAAPGDGVEHVVVHADARPGPVIGLFLRAADLRTAEATAKALWIRAREAQPWLRQWELCCAEAPLLLLDLPPENDPPPD
ncbi:hypothetical protein ACH4UT_09610 [Streptomyces sp. NPDC020799]|uniref:hypothetical protein n=1 Tax=Streptomyces sp. NPDC020799 TaxID=3365091 RepID=UPI0037B3E573